jgi:hypothetical protein
MFPMPARPVPGSVVTHKSLFPHSTQLICSCRKAANTNSEKIVQCRNPKCFVGWYHYKCLDRSGKAYGRNGNFLCDVCYGEEYWSKGKKQGATDYRIPFTKEELVQGVSSMAGGIGVHDPYGLCAYNSAAPDVGAGGPMKQHCEVGGVVYHEDEDEAEAGDEDENQTEDEDKVEGEEMVPTKKQKVTGEFVPSGTQSLNDAEHTRMAQMEEEMDSENIADTDDETDESSGEDVA